jgi:hypothetical protein
MNHPRTAATLLRVVYKRVSEARRLYTLLLLLLISFTLTSPVGYAGYHYYVLSFHSYLTVYCYMHDILASLWPMMVTLPATPVLRPL